MQSGCSSWEVDLTGEYAAFSQTGSLYSGVTSLFALAFLSSQDICGLWPGRLCILSLGRRGINHLLSSVFG